MEDKKIFQTIKSFSQMGKLSIFIGAGISRLSGYPSWGTLVENMADEIAYSSTKDEQGNVKFSSEELLKIPQIYYNDKGEELYRKKVQNAFEGIYEPNRIHDMIMSLHPAHILTTNYDTLIEKVAIKFGRNFSVINSNKVVSQSATTNYIVKVHGDFSGDFVLKEQDYLDYENNYVLIDNIVKTIFATNLVIFIGYGLNDYNIKLILNWVKHVQSDSFIQPIFVNVGQKISDLEINYQIGRGLRVIDCNNYTNDEDYLIKYEAVLGKILSYGAVTNLDGTDAKLQYLYDKIEGIGNLSYIRRKDFNSIFYSEYELNDQWNIINKTIIQKRNGILEDDIDELRINAFEDLFCNKEDYKIVDLKKYNVIENFIKACEINVISNSKTFILKEIKIENPAFYCKFNEIKDFCLLEYESIPENFRKAYYLAQLGEYAKSYELYTKILREAKQTEKWDVYYLCQINRNYLYSIIKQSNFQTSGVLGFLTFGQELKLFDEQFLGKIEYEMDKYLVEIQFSELPYDFKSKYAFLENYSQRNCCTKEYVELVAQKYDIEKELTKNVINLGGLSKSDKLKLDMLETVKFIYDNMILFSGFDENKLYVKNALIAWIESYYKDIHKDTSGFLGKILNNKYKFTLIDIILMSKTFKNEDVEYLVNKIELASIPFEECEKLVEYIKMQLESYDSIFNDTLSGGEIYLWKIYSAEIRMLLIIASFFVKDEECSNGVIKFIVDRRDRDFDVSEKIKLVRRWICIGKGNSSKDVIEIWLINCLELVESETASNGQMVNSRTDVTAIASLLIDTSQDGYICESLSRYIIEKPDDLHNLKFFANQIYGLVSNEAKKLINNKCKLENVHQVLERFKAEKIPQTEEIFNLFDLYLSSSIDDVKKAKREYTFPSRKDQIGEIAVYMLINDFPPKVVKKYYGICPEYDFLLNEDFMVTEFDIHWLFKYSYNVYQKIKETSDKKEMVIKVINDNFHNSLFNEHDLRELFDLYKFMNEI